MSILLLICHVGTLINFAYQWIQSISGKGQQQPRPVFFIHSNHSSSEKATTATTQWKNVRLSPIYITSTMLTSNFIGIVFARTLHYQFYSWYYHAIPFLLFCNDIYNDTSPSSSTSQQQQKLQIKARTTYWTYPIILRIGIIVSIEMAFLTFPATPYSSLMLQIAHVLIILQIRPPPYHLFLCHTANDDNDIIDVDSNETNNETFATKSSTKKVD